MSEVNSAGVRACPRRVRASGGQKIHAMLPSKPRCLLTLGAWACLLTALPHARADDLKIGATLGIGGRYRTGTWLPATITIVNSGADTIHGQVQLYAADTGGGATGSLFARPADIAASGPAPQNFQVYARDLDPARDEVIAQLVSGPERGDGRVLIKTSSVSNTTTGRSGFSGVAVADNDLFLVGLSADPSAFTFLNSQKWGLMHTAGGLAPEPVLGQPGGRPGVVSPVPSASRASVQSAAASTVDLPDRPGGYGGVDAVLLRADAPLDALSEAQTDALKAWVAGGGHLIVCGGADPAPYANAFFGGLLPASVGPASTANLPGIGPLPALLLTPKPLPGVRVEASVGGRPTVVSGPCGAGRVTLVAFDPTASAFRGVTSPRATALWKQLVLGQSSSLLNVIATHEEGAGSRQYGYYGGWPQLSAAVMRAPALDAPGAGVVGLFLLAYILILVPINYLVLKRLDKKEWAWVSVPVIVVVFAATTYGVGYAAKGSTVFVNRAAVLETTAGERRAGLYTEVGLFSPHRTTYDLSIGDPTALAAIPVPPDDYSGYGRRSPSGPNSYGQTRFVEDSGDVRVQDAAVNMWAMRAFDVQTATDLGGVFSSTLAVGAQTGQVQGTVTNHTSHALTECHLFLNGQWANIADLPAGVSVPLSVSFPAGAVSARNAQQWAQMPPLAGRNDQNDPDSDVRQRMRASLADFVRGLGANPNYAQGQYYGSNYVPPVTFQPQPGEAILTGWSAAGSLAGSPVRVDGHPVTQNDVTLVVVHLPLH